MKKYVNGIVRLGKLEFAIMNVIWDHGTATVRDVRQTLPSAFGRAYTTVLTTMRKLEGKGYRSHAAHGRAHVYRPIVTRQQVRNVLLTDLVERVFDGSVLQVMAGLLEQKQLRATALGALDQLISTCHRRPAASAAYRI